VQASPLSRALKGAISFDNLSGASASARKGDKRILYASETAARAVGSQITLHAYDAGKLATGMPIRYLGIDIGQISNLQLIADRSEVQATGVLYPEYVQTFARGGTRFSLSHRKSLRRVLSILIRSCSPISMLNLVTARRVAILKSRKPRSPTPVIWTV
jgi:paraquat-inducible protein B